MTPESGRHEHPQELRLWTWIASFWLAHHLAVFVHEYAHSLTAFGLGFKANPFELQFGGLAWANLLLLSGIDEHVDYVRMFAANAGWAVALVAFAGPGLGNGLTYVVSASLMKPRHKVASPLRYLFGYMLNLMSVGNFFSYLPIRTFTSHGDMAHLAQGLGIAPAWIVVLLGLPTLGALIRLFTHTLPEAQKRLASGRPAKQQALALITISTIFLFFGMAGWAGYGPASHALSAVSLLAAPVVMAWLYRRTRPTAS